MHTNRRFMFDTIEAASEGLATVLEDARKSKVFYQFSGLTPEQVLTSGLYMSGELDAVTAKLDALEGTVSYQE